MVAVCGVRRSLRSRRSGRKSQSTGYDSRPDHRITKAASHWPTLFRLNNLEFANWNLWSHILCRHDLEHNEFATGHAVAVSVGSSGEFLSCSCREAPLWKTGPLQDSTRAQESVLLAFNREFHRLNEEFVAHLNGNVVRAWLDLRHLHLNLIVSLLHDRGLVVILVVGQVHGGDGGFS